MKVNSHPENILTPVKRFFHENIHRDNTACRTFYVEKVSGSRRATGLDGDAVDGVNVRSEPEEREETDEALRGEEEVPMCESTLEDEEDDERGSLQQQPPEAAKGHDDSADEIDTTAKFRMKVSDLRMVEANEILIKVQHSLR